MSSLEDLASLEQLKILIGAGMYDRDLDKISNMVSTRRKLLAAERDANLLDSLSIGDKVLTRGVSPQYLNGQVGTVTEVLGNGRIAVDLGRPIRKYQRVLNFLPSQLTKTGE